MNHIIDGYECDLVWPEHGVIAELDTYVTHGSPRAFEEDRRRDRKLAPHWQVVRLTDDDTDGALADLSRVLAASAARSPRPCAWAA